MREAEIALEGNHVVAVLFIEPGSTAELDREMIGVENLSAPFDVLEVRAPAHEPRRKLEQHCPQLACAIQRLEGEAEAAPYLIHDLRRKIRVVEVLVSDVAAERF